jgi:DNA-binding NarL/FixJ family response regulator
MLQIDGDWRGAAREWARQSHPYEAAFALLDGDEPALREALAEFERLGAKPAAALASRRLREMGARGIPRGPRASTSADADGLTSRERDVLDLLADNLSNAEIAARLFLSEKTVAHHVSAILGKMDVRSRAAAVDARARRRVAPVP